MKSYFSSVSGEDFILYELLNNTLQGFEKATLTLWLRWQDGILLFVGMVVIVFILIFSHQGRQCLTAGILQEKQAT